MGGFGHSKGPFTRLRLPESAEQEDIGLPYSGGMCSQKRCSALCRTTQRVARRFFRNDLVDVALDVDFVAPENVVAAFLKDDEDLSRSVDHTRPADEPPTVDSDENAVPESDLPVCEVCFNEISRRIRLECGHNVCVSCMRHCMQSSIRSLSFPLTCPSCGWYATRHIEDSLIRRLVSPADWKLYCKGSVQAALGGDPNKVCCPTPDCPNIFLADSSVRWVQCGICEKEDNAHVKRKSNKTHSSSCCDNESYDDYEKAEKTLRLQFEELMKEDRNYAKCPKCKVSTVKDSGYCRMVIGKPNGRYDWHFDQFWSTCFRKKYRDPNQRKRFLFWTRR
ncbi:hypothetical protein BC829DRAFT_388109 [Chytridium lagenaria]|nr:hypothetical protein BC829DRAFT_388109 [Chytridium lagenaria]